LCAALCAPAASQAHDSWVETNTNIVRVGDAIHIDLKLGNHGNEHRDFKLASKLDPAPVGGSCTLQVLAPGGKGYDLKSGLIDTGYTPKEGFWTTIFVGDKPGLYCVAHTYDSVMSYAPERSIKSGKAFFLLSRSLDRVSMNNPGFSRRLGHPLELVPESSPITPMGPGTPLTVRVYFKGKPLPNCRVSFVPQGATLKEGFDARYEQKTNANGRVRFTPDSANEYLIAAHHDAPTEKGKGYDFTKYSATMTLFVPQICPCCGG
jgi:uncharacterized GH25 family protein